ncbi:transporter substrate-binding domain-containing protein [Hahella sp. CR1]|uniref:substrate-binding periplasmic protein n=1 Tax=Hahella sp. CR1 TaxID=2992807 RepID=UPI002442B6E9|nr:transporter substrate-binding domain-containing protein [Hahella sp. CR1]MDG9667085.1 transporter substrate-binding domain-containing protein [Hahella sp. CR1]
MLYIVLVIPPLLLPSCPATAQETITIATGEYIPWTSQEAPQGGFVNHVIQEAFKRQDIDVRFEYFLWARSYELARQGMFQAASYWVCSEDRQKDFICSDPLVEEKTVFFHSKSKVITQWDTLEDLRGYRIGATIGYTYTKEFWAAANSGMLNVGAVPEDEQNFNMLLMDRLDLCLMGQVAGLTLLRKKFPKYAADLITYHPKPLVTATLHLLFPKANSDSKRLVRQFNMGLKQVWDEGLYRAYTDDLMAGKYDPPTP